MTMLPQSDSVSEDDRSMLVIISLFFGVLVGLAAGKENGSVLIGIFVGLGYAILHPVLGTLAAILCEFLARKALTTEGWNKKSMARAAAFWPFVTAFWLILFLPTAIVNHFIHAGRWSRD